MIDHWLIHYYFHYYTIGLVYYGWRKVLEEFIKRMDPELPFYYHTSSHCRFYEGMMPKFSVKPSKQSACQDMNSLVAMIE